MSDFDVAVIGGGIHGCSAALNLARRGLRVVVLERDRVGRHASGANAGGVRTLLRHEAEIPLALAAREIWHGIEQEVGEDCGYHTTGQLAVAENEAAMADLIARHRRLAALGYDHEELVDAGEVRALAPGIADHVKGGLIAKADGAAIPYQATQAYARAASRAGVRLFEGAAVDRLEQAGGGWRIGWPGGEVRAATLVNAAGAWGDRIAALAGEAIPLSWFLPMMMVTARVPHSLTPVVINTARPLSFKQLANGCLLIGGGRPAAGSREDMTYRLDFRGLKVSAQTTRDLFPAFADVPIVRAWAGFEGRFQDDIPVIGRSREASTLVHAFGFCGHGFQLAPIVGRLIAELIVDGAASLPLAPFSPSRFNDVAREVAPAAAAEVA